MSNNNSKQEQISNYIEANYYDQPPALQVALFNMMDAFYDNGYLPNEPLWIATKGYLKAAHLEHLFTGVPEEALRLLMGSSFQISSRYLHSNRQWWDSYGDEMKKIRNLFLDVWFFESWPISDQSASSIDANATNIKSPPPVRLDVDLFANLYMNRDITYPHDVTILKDLISRMVSDMNDKMNALGLDDTEKHKNHLLLEDEYLKQIRDIINKIETGEYDSNLLFHFM